VNPQMVGDPPPAAFLHIPSCSPFPSASPHLPPAATLLPRFAPVLRCAGRMPRSSCPAVAPYQRLSAAHDLGVTRCDGLLPFLPQHWWAVCLLAAGALAGSGAGVCPVPPWRACGARSFLLLVLWCCSASAVFCFVSVRVAFGA
jgi:hypothetical protein